MGTELGLSGLSSQQGQGLGLGAEVWTEEADGQELPHPPALARSPCTVWELLRPRPEQEGRKRVDVPVGCSC